VSKPKKNGAAATGNKDAGSNASAKPSRPVSNTAGLEVIAKADGFRRAGIAWTKKPKHILLADLTDDQENLLRTCPGLMVRDVQIQHVPATALSGPGGEELKPGTNVFVVQVDSDQSPAGADDTKGDAAEGDGKQE
jgi:hypothetical protein